MLSATAVVICNSWTLLHLPLGNKTTMSTLSSPRTPSIAALPVSPDVPAMMSQHDLVVDIGLGLNKELYFTLMYSL